MQSLEVPPRAADTAVRRVGGGAGKWPMRVEVLKQRTAATCEVPGCTQPKDRTGAGTCLLFTHLTLEVSVLQRRVPLPASRRRCPSSFASSLARSITNRALDCQVLSDDGVFGHRHRPRQRGSGRDDSRHSARHVWLQHQSAGTPPRIPLRLMQTQKPRPRRRGRCRLRPTAYDYRLLRPLLSNLQRDGLSLSSPQCECLGPAHSLCNRGGSAIRASV